MLSGKLPLKQLELNPARDSGSQCGAHTSEHHQVRGGGGGGGAASLTLAAGHMHGQSGHKRPEMAPRMQVLDPGSRAGDFPHKWEGGGMGEGADVSNTQVVTQLVGFPCRSWSFVNTPSHVAGTLRIHPQSPHPTRVPTEPHLWPGFLRGPHLNKCDPADLSRLPLPQLAPSGQVRKLQGHPGQDSPWVRL